MDAAFPVALVFGMDPKQYWEDDPGLFAAYREAHRQRTEQINHKAWLNGLYTYVAISRLVPVLRAFSKARRPQDYLDAPLGSEEAIGGAAKEARRSQRRTALIAQFEAVAERDRARREGATDA